MDELANLVAPGEKRPRGKTPVWIWLATVGLVAFVVRAWHVSSVLGSPLADTLVLDSSYYHAEALRLLGHLDVADPAGVRFMNLGYPYFLAAIYALAGASVPAVLWTQVAVGSLTAVVLALAIWEMFRRTTTAVVTGLAYALYAGAVFYDGLLLTPTATNLPLAITLLGMSRYMRTASLPACAVAGLAVALAILLRANMFLLVPALVAVVFASGSAPRFRRFAAAALLAGSAMALPGGVVLYNGLTFGQWASVSANGGMNFWVGNHRDSQGLYAASEFLESGDADTEERCFLMEARRRTGDPGLTLVDSGAFWFREGLREARSDVRRWLATEVLKLFFFWNRSEPKTNVSMAFVAQFSRPLASLPVGFGLIAVLGVAGIVCLLVDRQYARALLLASFVAVPLITCLVFFVSGEYRHPAALALCAGAGVMLEALRHPMARRIGIPVVAGILTLPLVSLYHPVLAASIHPDLDYSNFTRAMTSRREGVAPPTREDFRRAIALLDRSRESAEWDLLLKEARLVVHSRAATRFEDPDDVRHALDLVKLLSRSGLWPGPPGYSDRFISKLQTTLCQCVQELALLESVRSDPALRRKAALLGESCAIESNHAGTIRVER